MGGKEDEYFAATPPLEALKAILSLAVTRVAGKRGKKRKIEVIDVRRAFFHAPALKDIYVELPVWDREEGMCGKLLNSLYGTRVVAANCMHTYMGYMEGGMFLERQEGAAHVQA